MAYRLSWSPTARLDLPELLAYIAEDDLGVARTFGRSVFRAIERLPKFPESGRVVPEFNESTLREVIRKPCRIVYRIRAKNQPIEIVHVWHSSREPVEL